MPRRWRPKQHPTKYGPKGPHFSKEQLAQFKKTAEQAKAAGDRLDAEAGKRGVDTAAGGA